MSWSVFSRTTEIYLPVATGANALRRTPPGIRLRLALVKRAGESHGGRVAGTTRPTVAPVSP